MRHVDLDQDYPEIKSWFLERKLKPIKKKFLPKNGLIIEKKCAVFIYETDTPICLIENLISKPGCPSFDIDFLIESAKSFASDLGYEVMIGTTNLKHVALRTTNLGFKKTGPFYHLITKL